MPKIYGFKIFGMRGSKYELKFDYQGKPINEEGIRQVLRRGAGDNDPQHVVTGLSGGLGKQKQPGKQGKLGSAENDSKEGGTLTHQKSKELLSQSQSAHLKKGGGQQA